MYQKSLGSHCKVNTEAQRLHLVYASYDPNGLLTSKRNTSVDTFKTVKIKVTGWDEIGYTKATLRPKLSYL